MRRDESFFRWYRTLPLMAVAVTAILCFALEYVPGMLLRNFFPVSHQEAILESSSRHGVDPRLVCAIISCESGWEEDAQSGVGAVGLMQVMPTTSETLVGLGYVDGWSYDAYNLSDPTTNIEYGCACLNYLDDNLETTDQVIAAYNAGIGTVQAWLGEGEFEIGDVIAYPETRVYLLRVNETYKIYQRLYDEWLQPK